MRVALAELLATRAIASEVLATVDPSQRADARYSSQEDALRAAQVLADLGSVDEATAARVKVVKALVAVAQGRPEADALAAIPESDVELRNVAKAAPLWRDARATVPEGLMAALAGVGDRSSLGRVVLALAYQRAGDLGGARAEVGAVLASSPDQPAAKALSAQLEQAKPPDQPGTAPPDAPGVTPPDQPGTTPPPDTKATGPTENIDALITKGCERVEGGQAAEGVAMLERALARRPKDVDVLLCLGDGNSALGKWGKALKFYERALDRSPSMMTALSGAARAAERTGSSDKALRYYRHVLEQDPTNAKAKSFVDAHEGGTPGGGTPPEDETDG
jgi:tetratricopeptide (TPR) repeat protein